MKGLDVRNGWVLMILGFMLIIGLGACESSGTIRPPDPVDIVLFGTVTDDLGNPLVNVSILIYSQNRTIGGDDYEASLVTDSEGKWLDTLSTISGQTYTVVYSRTGYIDLIQSKSVTLGGDNIFDFGSIALPPTEMNDIYRVVLSWGSTPRDLDAHLTGPRDDGSRFHVYWNNRSERDDDGDPIARLISDRRDGFGPETIAIKKLFPGNEPYRFSVHNYSMNEVQGDSSLVTSSNAVVRVFSQDGLQHEYSISGDDAPSTVIGNTWRVFEINGETGEITFINEMYDGIGFGDESVFKLEMKPERSTIK